MKNVLITGVTSALGIALAKKLIQEGMTVTGMGRDVSKKPLLEGVHFISCDIRDQKTLLPHFQGQDAIVHAAALSSPWGKRKDFVAINVEGTKNVLRCGMMKGVQRFIHISTPSIYFNHQDRYQIREEEPLPKRFVNDYAETKYLAEKEVLKSPLDTIILRPRAIFGAHDRALLPRILKCADRKGVPKIKGKSVLVDVTYVENVVIAILKALKAFPIAFGKAFNITNGEPCDLHRLFEMLLEEMEISYHVWSVSPRRLSLMGRLLEMLSVFTGKEPLFTRYSAGVLTHSQTLAISKAKKELGYEPLISLKEGIRRYAEFCKADQSL